MPDIPYSSPSVPKAQVRCFDKGARVPRSDMIKAASKFCTDFKRRVLDYDDPKDYEISIWKGSQCHPTGYMSRIELTLTAKKGCKYTIDGDSANDTCVGIVGDGLLTDLIRLGPRTNRGESTRPTMLSGRFTWLFSLSTRVGGRMTILQDDSMSKTPEGHVGLRAEAVLL